jgi:hypothetical protein
VRRLSGLEQTCWQQQQQQQQQQVNSNNTDAWLLLSIAFKQSLS